MSYPNNRWGIDSGGGVDTTKLYDIPIVRITINSQFHGQFDEGFILKGHGMTGAEITAASGAYLS